MNDDELKAELGRLRYCLKLAHAGLDEIIKNTPDYKIAGQLSLLRTISTPEYNGKMEKFAMQIIRQRRIAH